MTGTSGTDIQLQKVDGFVRQDVQLATFRVDCTLYAIDILRIKEIIRPLELTFVPNAPRFIEGVINLRGAVIPIINLRKRFSAPKADVGQSTRMIICSVSRKLIGLVVDEVVDVRRYTRDDLQPSLGYDRLNNSDFILGVARRDNNLLMVLDLDRIVLSSEIIDTVSDVS